MHLLTAMARAKTYEQTETFTVILGNKTRTIAIGLLKADPYFSTLKVVLTPIDPDVARKFPQTRGIEHPRMMRLLYNRGEFAPLIYLLEDSHHILADGNHRYYVGYLQNRKLLPAIIVPEHIWSPYVLTGMELVGMGDGLTPEELQKSWSGIK